MRSKQEIIEQVDIYREKLACAIEEKELYPSSVCQDVDLVIFALIDKIEALFWVLELDLPNGDIIDKITGIKH
ncbi:MAG: hypothetical protein PHN47_00155 [Clostridia bacterium]|nr:hypothetical protein [Clostridia bacterium]MDD4570892.1 hypothetical protein [Clostridia bacterium]